MKYTKLLLGTGALFTALSLQLNAANVIQTITPEVDAFTVLPGDTIDFPLTYSSDASESTGVGVHLSFDSSKLKFLGFTEQMEQGLLASDKVSKREQKNIDEDGSTDAIASIAWMSVDGKWPGDTQLPTTLGVAHFKVLNTEDSVTQINITGDAAAQSTISAKPISVTIGQENTLAASDTTGGGGGMTWMFMPFLLMLGLLKSISLFRQSS